MTRREQRVIDAFTNCVNKNEYTFDYAVTLIEDSQRYGWLSNEAKDAFYATFEVAEEPQVIPEGMVDFPPNLVPDNAPDNIPDNVSTPQV